MNESKRVKILGVAGSVQTGKSELAPVFGECGWRFLDMNDPQCDLRAKGTSRYDLFNTRYPGCLKDDGSKTGTFYDLVEPEFYRERVLEDMSLLIPVVREWCESGSKPVALSWEYLPFVAHELELDHTLLFTSDYDVWMSRLNARLRSRGVPGKITTARIHKVLDLLDVWPDTIEQQVESKMTGHFSVMDVSGEDWGAAELRTWLQENGIHSTR